ncbi:MAG: hypothetical protein ACHQK8_02460 [Bacteroidia bacterium]
MFNIKNIAWLLFPVLFAINLQAQDEKPYVDPGGLNNWFVEMGGSAFFYSFNYEKLLFRSENTQWVGRVGLGYNPVSAVLLNKIPLDPHTIMAPFTTSFLFGKRKEKFELGLGFTMLAKSFTEREIVPVGIIGFRVVETNKVFFRVNYAPLIRDGKYVDWWGVSLGRNFNFK